ncbi:hypothetical protein FOCC_FOCC015915 [Frankliniella occidentalis]|nr:hypothetical protein FOCC_FOCC015915 [Frankliniella occidentalis]
MFQLQGSYYIAPDDIRDKSGGRLVNRYRNQKDKLNSLVGGSSATPQPSTSAAGADPYQQLASGAGPLFSDFDADQYSAAEEWLKTQTQPWPKVLECWRKTAPERLRVHIARSKTAGKQRKKKAKGKKNIEEDPKVVEKYIENWPILKHSSGYQLLTQDFNLLFPEKEDALFLGWKTFQVKLISLAAEQVVDDKGLEYLSVLQNNPTEDIEVLLSCFLIASVCQPSMKTTCPNTGDIWKVTINDSRNSFILHTKTLASLKDDLRAREAKNKRYQLRTQPIIVAVGSSYSKIDYYVSVCKCLYKVNNCFEALDSCFKAFFALHAEYPFESEQIWLLIQRCVFKIKTSYDNNGIQSFNECVPRLS